MLRLRPRVLVDVSNICMSMTLLGYNMSSPIMVAPTGAQKLAHPEGLDCILKFSMSQVCDSDL